MWHGREVLDAEQMQPSDRLDVLGTLDLIAARLRERLGESLTSVAAQPPGTWTCRNTRWIGISGFYGVMYPTFVRAKLYLAAHRGTKAAAEFRRIIAHPALLASDPMGVVARLELARALAMSGDRGGAQAAYGEFFAVWRAADADIPLLKAAQDEASRL